MALALAPGHPVGHLVGHPALAIPASGAREPSSLSHLWEKVGVRGLWCETTLPIRFMARVQYRQRRHRQRAMTNRELTSFRVGEEFPLADSPEAAPRLLLGVVCLESLMNTDSWLDTFLIRFIAYSREETDNGVIHSF